jgi:hypothetical protein
MGNQMAELVEPFLLERCRPLAVTRPKFLPSFEGGVPLPRDKQSIETEEYFQAKRRKEFL